MSKLFHGLDERGLGVEKGFNNFCTNTA